MTSPCDVATTSSPSFVEPAVPSARTACEPPRRRAPARAPRRGRTPEPGRLARAPARAVALVAASRVHERAPLPQRVRCRGRHARTTAKALADIARFPFTTKADLRDHYPFGMFAVPQPEVRRIHASSGTTGQPTVVGYTQDDLDIWADLMARSIRAAGGRRGDIVHVAYGYGLFTGGLGAHYGAERLGCTVVPVSGGMTPRQVQLIRDFEPAIIMVTPSYMLALIDEFERQGVDPRTCSLRIGIFGAEPWTEAMRGEIEERLDMHAVDIYGLSEVMGPGVSAGVRRDQGRPPHLGGPFLPGGDRPDQRRGASGRGDRRAGVHVIDQAGAADHPLPDPRSHAAAARHGASGFPAHGEGHRAERRHDHPARRQRLPDATRGARRRAPAASRRTSS